MAAPSGSFRARWFCPSPCHDSPAEARRQRPAVGSDLIPHGGSPIRGTATKDSYVASSDTSEDDNGNVTTRTVISERPRLVIRVLDSQGNITNLE